ncbi:hypothetical protein V5799_021659 [Amblyomma americanum]|uniref:Uncharacterized protein n=1 Tax=Amblyomma americanum TaxID=6943 RepID=A0AAQ4FPC4_AMBAM
MSCDSRLLRAVLRSGDDAHMSTESKGCASLPVPLALTKFRLERFAVWGTSGLRCTTCLGFGSLMLVAMTHSVNLPLDILDLAAKIVTGLNFTNCKVKRSSVEACFCTRPSSVESFHWLYWRSIRSLCTGWISLEVKIGAPSHHSQ